jgi:hypothetical protein
MISQQWPQVQWPYSATEQKQQQVGAPSNETKNKPVEGYDNPLAIMILTSGLACFVNQELR